MGKVLAFVLMKFSAYFLLLFGLIYLFYSFAQKNSEDKLKEALADVEPFEPKRTETIKLVTIIGLIVITIILWRARK